MKKQYCVVKFVSSWVNVYTYSVEGHNVKCFFLP